MERPAFDLEKFILAIEKNGVEKTLVKMGRDLAILTWKFSQMYCKGEKKP